MDLISLVSKFTDPPSSESTAAASGQEFNNEVKDKKRTTMTQ